MKSPGNTTFLLYIDATLKKELEREAKAMGISLSSYMKLILVNRNKVIDIDKGILR